MSDRKPEEMADEELYAMAARTKAKVAEALSDLIALNGELRRRVGLSRDMDNRPTTRPEGAA